MSDRYRFEASKSKIIHPTKRGLPVRLAAAVAAVVLMAGCASEGERLYATGQVPPNDGLKLLGTEQEMQLRRSFISDTQEEKQFFNRTLRMELHDELLGRKPIR